MSDLIRREDAIEAVKALLVEDNSRHLNDLEYGHNEGLCHAVDALEELPSAETEIEIIRAKAYAKGIDSERKRISDWCRPQGEWIYTMNPLRLNDEWECSKCGYLSFTKANYCGHCGCRMKGADDYERAIEQTEHDMLYEPTYNSEDGSM